MKKLFGSIVLFICLFNVVYTQSAVDAGGISGKSLLYLFTSSVGELTVNTLKSSDNQFYATNGVIQPEEFFLTPIEEESFENQILYPIPSSTALYFYPGILAETYYTIYSMNGILFTQSKLLNSTIDIRNYPSGYYEILLTDKGFKNSKSFKFIKS